MGDIQATIFGALPTPLQGGHEDNQRLLHARAKDFSSDVVHRLKNLGIISSLQSQNPERWQEIMHGIEQGTLTIGEIIEKLR